MIIKRISLLILSFLVLIGLGSYILITKNSGLNAIISMAEVMVPGKLHVATAKGSLWSGGELQQISYENEKLKFTLDKVSFKLLPTHLLWSQVHFSQLTAQGLHIVTKPSEEPTSSFDFKKLNFPVAMRAPHFSITDISFSSGNTPTLINKITANVVIKTASLQITDMDVVAPGYHVAGDFLLSPHNNKPIALSLKSQGNWPNNPWQVQADMWGDFEHIQAKLSGLFPKNAVWRQVVADATVEVLNDKILIQNLTIKRIKENKAPNAPQGVDAQDGVLILTGSIPFAATDPILLEGNGQHILLPTLKDTTIDLTAGHFSLRGRKDNYMLAAQGMLQLNDKITAATGVEGKGDLNGLQLNKIYVKPMIAASKNNMSLTGHANLQWAPQLSWQVDVEAQNVDPELFAPTLPGAMHFTVKSTGTVKDKLANASIHIDKISGTLNKQPANGDIALTVKNNVLNIDDFKLMVADNRIQIKGQVAERLNVNWQINALHIEHFLSMAKGSFISSGQLQGKWATPQMIATVNAQKLTLPHLTVDKVEGKTNIYLTDDGNFDVALQVNNLQYDTYHVDTLTLNTHGKRDSHTITLSGKQTNNNLAVKLQGGWRAGYWQGSINDLSLHTEALDNWRLQNKAALLIGMDKVVLSSPLCLSANTHKICVEAAWQQTGSSFVKINSTRLPLSLFKLWLPTQVSLKGDSELHFFWQQDVKKGVQTQGNWRILPGILTVQRDKDVAQVFSYVGGNITTTLKNNNIVATADLELWRQSRLTGTLSIANGVQKSITTQPVQGSFKINVPDLQWLQHWSQDIHNVRGQLQTDVKLSGTLANPTLAGSVEIKDASIEIPKRGVNFNHIKLLIKSEASQQFRIAGEAMSGPGRLTVAGRASLDKGAWNFKINIDGDNVQFSNTPEADILASPQLALSYSNSLWQLHGKVLLPRAIIKPRLFASAVHVSNDVIITTPGTEDTPEKVHMPLLISANIELILGKQVHFEGFNLSTNVTGSLRIIHEPKQITRGIGILRAQKGEYNAYGKTLTVSSGQLIYNGNAIDDPAFNIRAERSIDVLAQAQEPLSTMPDKNALPQISPDKSFPDLNNIQSGTVGIVGSGTLKNPRFRLFSNPSMPETDILSYLLLGVPTSQVSDAQGQILFQALNQMSSSMGPGDTNRFMNLLRSKFGLDDVHLQTSTYLNRDSNKSESQTAVVLGKSLSPRLFINYSIGLLDPVNVLQITYKISRNWSVQTDANNRGSSGGDIVYSIERN